MSTQLQTPFGVSATPRAKYSPLAGRGVGDRPTGAPQRNNSPRKQEKQEDTWNPSLI